MGGSGGGGGREAHSLNKGVWKIRVTLVSLKEVWQMTMCEFFEILSVLFL